MAEAFRWGVDRAGVREVQEDQETVPGSPEALAPDRASGRNLHTRALAASLGVARSR